MARRLTRRRRRGAGAPATELRVGDLVVVEAGEVIPGDGDIVEGIATVDESAITGESAPVIRESGGDRSSVTGGTTVLSDRIVVQITTKPGESFVDRMIALVEGAARQKTPNEIALTILLAALTIIFLLAVVALQPMAGYAGAPQSLIVLTALLVCLIPTTIGALLSAIGIAGMDRLVQRNVLATSGRAVEAAGDVDTLLLDKTGTITFGNRQATELHPAPGVDAGRAGRGGPAVQPGRRDPGGPQHRRALRAPSTGWPPRPPRAEAAGRVRRRSPRRPGCPASTSDGRRRSARAPAAAVAAWVARARRHGAAPRCADRRRDRRATAAPRWWSPSGPADRARACSASSSCPTWSSPACAERFAELRAMGIRTVMITGDNPLTARAIAGEAGVDDYLAEATPEDKMALIRKEQEGGRLVAMTGDGTNDAPGAGPGRRRRGDEHRDGRGQGGRQHGRPRLRPDQADRDRRDRQAAADHPRRADHVLASPTTWPSTSRSCRPCSSALYPQLDALNIMRLATPGVGDPVRGDLQRADHRRADPAGPARRALPAVVGRERCCAATC